MSETTIKVKHNTKIELNRFKQYKNESYDELVRKLLYLVKTFEKDPKLGQQVILDIKDSRDKFKNEMFYSEEEYKKILGLD